jgi:hypothetical protein
MSGSAEGGGQEGRKRCRRRSIMRGVGEQVDEEE